MRSSIISRTTLTLHLQKTLAVHSSSLVFRTHKESRSVGIYDREPNEQTPGRAGRSRAVSMAKTSLWLTYVSFAPVLAFPTSSAGSLTPLRNGLLIWLWAVGHRLCHGHLSVHPGLESETFAVCPAPFRGSVWNI